MSTANTIEVVVQQMSLAADRVLMIELRPTDPDGVLPPFQAGAHIDLHVGAWVRSIRCWVVTIRHATTASRCCTSVTVGVAPAPGAHHHVLLAGGIGLTPLVSMAERLHRDGESFEFHVYSASERTVPLWEYLKTLFLGGSSAVAFQRCR